MFENMFYFLLTRVVRNSDYSKLGPRALARLGWIEIETHCFCWLWKLKCALGATKVPALGSKSKNIVDSSDRNRNSLQTHRIEIETHCFFWFWKLKCSPPRPPTVFGALGATKHCVCLFVLFFCMGSHETLCIFVFLFFFWFRRPRCSSRNLLQHRRVQGETHCGVLEIDLTTTP